MIDTPLAPYNNNKKIFSFLPFTEKCPDSHPYAYLSGTHCCLTNREEIEPKDGDLCDGSAIGFTSSCCDVDRIQCPDDKLCENAVFGNAVFNFCVKIKFLKCGHVL